VERICTSPVDEFSADAALEEAAAAVARQDAVVFATRRVATHEASQPRRTALHQRRRQTTGVDAASASGRHSRGAHGRAAATGRHRCRHGRLVQDHSVDHRRREDGRRRRGGPRPGGRRSAAAGERRDGVVGRQVRRVAVVVTVEGGRRRDGADLGVGGDCGGGGRIGAGSRRWRRRTAEAAGDDRADRRDAPAART